VKEEEREKRTSRRCVLRFSRAFPRYVANLSEGDATLAAPPGTPPPPPPPPGTATYKPPSLATCAARNAHGWGREQLDAMQRDWEPTPPHMVRLRLLAEVAYDSYFLVLKRPDPYVPRHLYRCGCASAGCPTCRCGGVT